MKRGQQWFEKFLQICILITGFYIIFRGMGILKETGWGGQVLIREEIATVMEESAVGIYLPMYRFSGETLPEENLLQWWAEYFFPMLRYKMGQVREKEKMAEIVSEKTAEETVQTEERETEGGWEPETETETEPELETVADPERRTEMEEAKNSETMEESETELETEIVKEWEREAETESFRQFLNQYYSVDADTCADEELLNEENLLKKEYSLEKEPGVPQILIYHTHSQEFFLDSREEDVSTGIQGAGAYLAWLLETKYGYGVLHDRGIYDLVDGVLDRSAAYDYAGRAVKKILEEYPTIEVIIDLHRDGVEGTHFVTEIQGKPTARIMFFNGLSRNREGQELTGLPNPYVEDNLGFSLQLQREAERRYPGYTRRIYLKGQRFNLHFRPRSVLVEAGTQLNTLEEEKNAMEPLADILNRVLQGT